MSQKTKIEWTEATWNPVRGCTQITSGCKNCYAKTFAERFRGVLGHPYEQGFDLRLVPEKLDEPLRWREPRLVFVNSMSDLFHEGVPAEYILRVFDVIARARAHTFQGLTKRSERVRRLAPALPWPANLWMGVSVESANYTARIDDLLYVPAAVRWLSIEPLLGSIPNLSLEGIDWVVVGGESGPRARTMNVDWAREIRDQCLSARVPFFFKQFGHIRNNPDPGDDSIKRKNSPGKAKGGRRLDGRLWDQMPQPKIRRPAIPVHELWAADLSQNKDAVRIFPAASLAEGPGSLAVTTL
jgi:protein gp37